MKILLCHNHYQQRGGEDQVFDDEAALLESRGHEVLRFTRHNDSVEQMSRWTLARRTLWNRDVFDELTTLLRRDRPDLMHCTNTFPLLSPAVYDAASHQRVPVVQSLHNYRLLCPNALFLRDGKVCEDCLGKTFAWPAVQHACYRGSRAATGVLAGMLALHRVRKTWTEKVDRYVALSEFARQKLISGGLPAERITVKPNFVPSAPRPGHGEGGFALFVGRLSPEKGTQVLLDAWSQLPHPLPLRIVGDGPQADLVRQAAAADPRIKWLGRLAMPRVLEQMSQAAVLVLPSLCYEACPRTLIESLAVGTPVIASRLGSLIEMIDDGRTGWHFAAGDAAALARCLSHVVSRREELQACRSAAHREFLDKYTTDRNYEMLLDIYHSVLSPTTEAQSHQPQQPLLAP